MGRFPFDEFGRAFSRLPRNQDDLREREIDGPFLLTEKPLTSIVIGVAIWVMVVVIAERSASLNGRIAAVSAALVTQPDAAPLDHRR